jgi:hypothetical protein
VQRVAQQRDRPGQHHDHRRHLAVLARFASRETP